MTIPAAPGLVTTILSCPLNNVIPDNLGCYPQPPSLHRHATYQLHLPSRKPLICLTPAELLPGLPALESAVTSEVNTVTIAVCLHKSAIPRDDDNESKSMNVIVNMSLPRPPLDTLK